MDRGERNPAVRLAGLAPGILIAQFHVFRLSDGQLVLDLQSDHINTGTREVAPLVPVSNGLRSLTVLEPVFEIAGQPLALHTAEMAAIPAGLVALKPVADLTGDDYILRRALDMVFSGF